MGLNWSDQPPQRVRYSYCKGRAVNSTDIQNLSDFAITLFTAVRDRMWPNALKYMASESDLGQMEYFTWSNFIVFCQSF